MTSQSQFVNRAIVIGTLDTVRSRGKDAPLVERRNAQRGKIEQFAIQVRSPFGEPFALQLTAQADGPGSELLTREHIGKPIVVEGELSRVISFDGRYAESERDPGRRVRETRLSVTAVRERREDEPAGVSQVWLEGVVATPPRIVRHRSVAALELATTIVQMVMEKQSSYPGSRARIRETVEVSVAVPVTMEGAEALYRPGNRVRLEGALEMAMIPQRDEAVSAAVARLEREHAVAMERAVSEDERRRQQRRFRARYRQLTEAARATVVVGYIELLDGEPLSLGESQELRQQMNARAQARRLSATRRGAEVAVEAAGAGLTPSARPRRRAAAEAAAIEVQAEEGEPVEPVTDGDAAELVTNSDPAERVLSGDHAE